MSDLIKLSITGDILVFEVCTGTPLLPTLRDWLHNDFIPSQDIQISALSKVYLARGESTRRNFSNEASFVALLESRGFDIVNNSRLPIFDQLLTCLNSQIVVGAHGAQLLNAFMTTSRLLEILPFPYCFSPWSHTMIKMSDILSIEYIPFFASQLNDDSYIDIMSNIRLNNFDDFTASPESYQSKPLSIPLRTFNEFLDFYDF